MAVDKVGVEVEMEGQEEAKASTDALANSMENLKDKTTEAGAAQEQTTARTRALENAQKAQAQAQQQATMKAIEFTTKIAGAAGAVQSLAGQLGVQGGTIGLVASLAASVAAGGQFGATFGPQGAIVGGIAGALIPAIQSLIQSNNDLAESARLAAEEQSRLDEIAQRMSAERQAQIRREIENGQILTLTTDEIRRQRLLLDSQIQEAGRNIAHFQREMENSTGDRARRAGEDLQFWQEQVQRLVQTMGLLGQAEGNEISNPATRGQGTPTVRQRGSGGGGETMEDREVAAWDRRREAEQRYWDQIEAHKRREDEFAATRREMHQRELDEQREKMEATRRQIEIEQELAREAHDRQREQNRLLIESNREVAAQQREKVAAAQEYTSQIVGGLTSAIGKMIETNATAEESAKIMLATTLQMIGEIAAMQAALMFAEAAGAYPDFGKMAAKIAAGVAFTAVAIATGAGASALNKDVAKSQAARAEKEKEKPEKPDSTNPGGKGGGDIVINWNSPVVSGQTYAELGRQVKNMVRAADRRGM